MDSFVFYRSFLEAKNAFPKEYQLAFYDYLVECCLGDRDPETVPFPFQPSIIQALANVKAAHDRYEKAKEDGAKGGRPQKYIPPEEWQEYYKTHTRKETAEHFGVPEETLKKWIYAMGKKGKNLNVNVNTNVNDNANVNVNDISISNNNSRSRRGASEAPSLPALKEGERWKTEPYLFNGDTWAANYIDVDGTERTMVL